MQETDCGMTGVCLGKQYCVQQSTAYGTVFGENFTHYGAKMSANTV